MTQVAYNTNTMAALVSALRDLAAAYFERMANGDWARASVVLSVFANTYNAHYAVLRRWVAEQSVSRNPSLLADQADDTYTTRTRRALQASLVMGGVPATI